MSTMSTDGNVFVEVDYSNRLKRWVRQPNGYFGYTVADSSGYFIHAKAISGLSADQFIEFTDSGDLYLNTWNGTGYDSTSADRSVAGSRLITAVDAHHFITVSSNGYLQWWLVATLGGAVFPMGTIGEGWQDTAIIAGLGPTGECDLCFAFVEVKGNGLLSLWKLDSSFHLYERNIGQGWHTARMLAGLTYSSGSAGFTFMEVKTSGLLSEWRFRPNGVVTETNRGVGWENARLIG